MASDNQVVIDLLLGVEQANQRLSKLEKGFTQFGTSVEQKMGKANLVFSSFVGNLASNLASKALDMAAASASKFFNVFIVDGISAAQESESAINDLNVALSITGKYSQATSLELQDFAASIQEATAFEDDFVLSNMSVLQSLGNLSKDSLKRATLAATDLATSLKMDLGTAMDLLGKAAQGNIGTLSRYGLEIEKGSTDAETFSRVLGMVESKFGGSAQAAVKTYAGAIAQAKNAFGNLQEQTGKFIVQNPLVIKIINDVSKGFKFLSQWIGDNEDSILGYVNNGIIFLLKGLSMTLETIDMLVKYWTVLKNGVEIACDAMALTVSEFALSIVTYMDFAWGWIPGLGKKLESAKSALEDFSKGARDTLIEDSNEIANAFSEKGAIGKVVDGVDTYIEKMEQFAKTHKKLTQSEIKEEEKSSKKKKNIIEKTIAWYKEGEGERFKNLQASLGAISSLTASSNATLFGIGKASAIAQATIDGIAAVQKAWASAPFPFNIGIAALVGVATAANVAKIASQQPPKFAEGGIVGGNSTTGDKVPAMLNSREMVMTLDDQKELFAAIRGGGLGGNNTVVNLKIGSVDSDNRVNKLIRQINKASMRNARVRMA